MRKGIYAAQLVPYTGNGSVDPETLRRWVRHNIDGNGLDGLYVGGSTGESFLSSAEQRALTLRIAAEEARGKVSMIAQVGLLDYAEVLNLADIAAESGYDAISAVTPFYYNFSFDETLDYYRGLAKRTKLPLIVYVIPALTGKPFGLAEARRFLEIDGIAGIKFTTPDMYLLEQTLAAFPDARIFNGYDELLLPAAATGADSAIGSTYNIFGPIAKQILNLVGRNDLPRARQFQRLLNEAISQLVPIGLYQCLKLLMDDAGSGSGFCKPPFRRLTTEENEKALAIGRRVKKAAADLIAGS